MATSIEDIIRVNFVLVGTPFLGDPGVVEQLRRAITGDVQVSTSLIGDTASGMSGVGHTLELKRERITMELSQARSVIGREYPKREDISRLAEIAWQAIEHFPKGPFQPRGIGFNIEMVLEQDSETTAFAYLSRKLFAAKTVGDETWRLVGAAGRLIFRDDRHRWTVSLEPRFNDENEQRVFLSCNLHLMYRPTLHDEFREGDIAAYLDKVWDRTCKFVEHLDEGSACDD